MEKERKSPKTPTKETLLNEQLDAATCKQLAGGIREALEKSTKVPSTRYAPTPFPQQTEL
eukprot:5926529-Amphidinium_carterae.1